MTILEDIRAIYDKLKPKMYYALSLHVPQGKALRTNGDDFYPPVWHMHPWDFAEYGAELSTYARLVDFHTWEPTQEDINRSVKAWFEKQRSEPIILRDSEPEFKLWSFGRF